MSRNMEWNLWFLLFLSIRTRGDIIRFYFADEIEHMDSIYNSSVNNRCYKWMLVVKSSFVDLFNERESWNDGAQRFHFLLHPKSSLCLDSCSSIRDVLVIFWSYRWSWQFVYHSSLFISIDTLYCVWRATIVRPSGSNRFDRSCESNKQGIV